MSKTAIEFQNVSKRYFIGEYSLRTLHKDIYRLAGNLFGEFRENDKNLSALKDVTFKIKSGENVGIIGPNGSGKTTLFKLISRITFPTAGKVMVSGKVCSMIALNFGFHHELTGIENIYINSAIYGMEYREISKNIDRILSFAEIERFKDTPLKHYSAGMLARLGFSVAIHCPFDILLIDEVVAVADIGFKNKCLDKISELKDSEKTVLFISHDFERIKQLCSRVIYLSYGNIIADTNTQDAINSYVSHSK